MSEVAAKGVPATLEVRGGLGGSLGDGAWVPRPSIGADTWHRQRLRRCHI